MPEKGWDRASLDFNFRPDRIDRDIARPDLLAPIGEGGLRLFAICLACGLMLSVLLVWTTLAMAAILGLISAPWVYAIVLAAALGVGLSLYVLATWDFKRWRKWAEEA